MAGIGFEIRKLLHRGTYVGAFRAYAYAGIIGSGPLVLSLVGILLIHVLGRRLGIPGELVSQFQTSVTYVIAFSLISSGFITLTFTRFASDRIFEDHENVLTPNFLGALALTTAVSCLAGALLAWLCFPGLSVPYRVMMAMAFVTMNGVWLSSCLLSGLKKYMQLVWLFGIGYALVVAVSLGLRRHGLEGLLAGYVLGQFVMLAGMLILILRNYPPSRKGRAVTFTFLRKGRWYPVLSLIGVVYSLAIWADKFIFWFHSTLGQTVIGPLRSSLIYDIPIFLSYISTFPGMAVFLVRMETDFVQHYQEFYSAVREGGSLQRIREAKEDMIDTVRQGILEIAKIQGIAMLFTMVWGPALLRWLGISSLYLPLLYVDVVSAGLQVVFLGLCNVLFYLDKQRTVLGLTAFLLFSNVALTYLSIRLGLQFYGYGFAFALLISVLAGMIVLDRDLRDLEYRTFMTPW